MRARRPRLSRPYCTVVCLNVDSTAVLAAIDKAKLLKPLSTWLRRAASSEGPGQDQLVSTWAVFQCAALDASSIRREHDCGRHPRVEPLAQSCQNVQVRVDETAGPETRTKTQA